MNVLPYDELPAFPTEISATNTIARLVDGLAFRYRWATEDLTENFMQFKPVESSMSAGEVMYHIYNLAFSANRTFGGNPEHDKTTRSLEELRTQTLGLYHDLSLRLRSMQDDELALSVENNPKGFPFWFWLNGPIADALTHVGQITSWRRMDGNPQPTGVNVFLGKKS